MKSQEQIEKLAELGALNAEIVHEMDNAFGVIQSGLAVVKSMVDEDETLDREHLGKLLASLVESAQLLNGIFHSVKTFASPDEKTITEVNLSEVIRKASHLTRERLRMRDIRFLVNVDHQIKLRCSEVLMLQFFLNMISNASDAIQDLKEKWIRIEAVKQKNQWLIRFSDSGKGIAPELREKIMQPGFTTKKAGHGTGLGLSICQRVADFHRGQLSIDEKNPHTCFLLSLPL